MFKLYYFPQSCSLIPHIYLEELQADYEAKIVNLRAEEQHSEEFRKINGKGKIPVLVHNDKTITETLAIVSYLADVHPETNFFPRSNIIKKSDVMEWMAFFLGSLHTNFIRLFRPYYFFADKQYFSAIQKQTNQEIEEHFTNLDVFLKDRNYLNGDEIQICDICLFNYGRWGNLAEKPTKAYPNLARFMERVAERSSVKRALKQEKITLYRDVAPPLPT